MKNLFIKLKFNKIRTSISYIINKRRLIREAELSEYGIGEDRPSILNGGGY